MLPTCKPYVKVLLLGISSSRNRVAACSRLCVSSGTLGRVEVNFVRQQGTPHQNVMAEMGFVDEIGCTSKKRFSLRHGFSRKLHESIAST